MLLHQLDPDIERVYLVGPRPAHGWLSWALEGLGAWRPGQHYLEGAHPVLRYSWLLGGRRPVALHHAETFFPGDYTPREATEAWRTLGALIAGAFDGATLLDTPATTGRELMLRSIPKDREWPVLSTEHQELIRATSGQARIETLPFQHGAGGNLWKVPALYEYDMRLAYAASAWELGAGVPVHDHYAEYMGQQRGRYRVRVTVADDWPHPFGVLGVKDGNEGWRYPCTPGETFETWADGAELHVALKHGFLDSSNTVILERLLFDAYDGPGPLDLWRDRLVRIYNALGADIRIGGARTRALARDGVRSIILHSIGALHADTHEITRFATDIDRVPDHARAKVRFEGPYVLWPERTTRRWSEMQHPEWSAAIWARTRARLLDAPKKQGALNISGQVVAFSTDAIYLTARQDWADDRQPGRFRLKRWGDGPYPWPTNRTDVIRLRNALPNVEVEA